MYSLLTSQKDNRGEVLGTVWRWEPLLYPDLSRWGVSRCVAMLDARAHTGAGGGGRGVHTDASLGGGGGG